MKSVIGHKSQIDSIKKALSLARLPNAYLFCGPAGIGKRKLADAIVAAIACKTAKDNQWNSCGACAGCQKSLGKNHPDQFFVLPDGESIKIEQIRELQTGLQFHPLESPSKIVIIDDADKMTDSASNSLLKVLEEPPPETHFILISSKPFKLLPTIRSRCQIMTFSPLPLKEVENFLVSHKDVPAEDAARLAKLSGGSIGEALSLDAGLVDDVIGKLVALCRKGSSADVIETSEVWGKEPIENIRLILNIMFSWYRDILRLQATGNLSDSIHRETQNFASTISIHKTERTLDKISSSRSSLDGNANRQLMFEELLFTLTSP